MTMTHVYPRLPATALRLFTAVAVIAAAVEMTPAGASHAESPSSGIEWRQISRAAGAPDYSIAGSGPGVSGGLGAVEVRRERAWHLSRRHEAVRCTATKRQRASTAATARRVRRSRRPPLQGRAGTGTPAASTAERGDGLCGLTSS